MNYLPYSKTNCYDTSDTEDPTNRKSGQSEKDNITFDEKFTELFAQLEMSLEKLKSLLENKDSQDEGVKA